MTVQELITKLQSVENKDLPVSVYWECGIRSYVDEVYNVYDDYEEIDTIVLIEDGEEMHLNDGRLKINKKY